MKPLEEYMLFTKQGSETVRATIPAGVRSAQCAVFHAQPRGLEPPRNDSVVRSYQRHCILILQRCCMRIESGTFGNFDQNIV